MDTQSLDGNIAAVAFLRSRSLFLGLPDGAVKQIVSRATLSEHPAEFLLLAEGHIVSSLSFVYTGRAQLFQGDENHYICDLNAGGIFGEGAALGLDVSPYSVLSSESVRCIHISSVVIKALVKVAPAVGKRLATLMASRSA